MYSSGISSSASSTTIPFTLPLDPELQSRSLHPLGTLQFNRPYGDLTFDKTKRTLSLPSSDENDALKLTSLEQLLELVSRPQKVQLILDGGIFAELVLNASNQNQDVRILATSALASLTAHRAGREFALQADIVPRLSRLASNEEPSAKVRGNVLKTLLHMSSSQSGIHHLITRGIVEQLVDKVGSESDLGCRAQTLEVLTIILREPTGWKTAMKAGLIPMAAKVLKKMLQDSTTINATEAVINANGIVATQSKPLFATIAMLGKVIAHVSAVALECKNDCVSCDIVPLLVSLLSHPVSSLRINSTLALQNLTNCVPGKQAALAAKAIGPLLDACQDPEEMVQCQAMQAITNLAEHPTAKSDPRVQAAVEQLQRMQATSPSDKVRHAAKLAIEQITWQP